MEFGKRLFLILILAVWSMGHIWAAETYPKREVRSVWLATVWAIDWPAKTGTSTSVATTQKAQMTAYLDKLKSQNFNSVYFQVRSMCDAMYKSSYEPWSSYLTGTRGATPAWDPLEWVVAECHKRGMECHAWVNPYRWASSASGWSTAQDVALKNAGLLLSYTSGSTTTIILNPGLPATNERICNVCKEIITKYDVDGIIFDDYFYPSGIPATSAADDYNLWKNSGTSLTFANWRRDNVNKMVAAVYNTIQAVNPAVKFGISPAGVACSSSSVAATHGVEPCYAGSDWQYNGIFSDPVQWLQDGTIDYISPQIYWRTDHSTNPFGPITQWWSKVAKKFNRHHYASHSVSALATSGNNNSAYWDNYCQQVQYSRDYTENDASGCVFYSTCNINGNMNGAKASGLGEYLKQNKFQHPSLTPAITWKQATPYDKVENLKVNGKTLSWDNAGKVKYSIYAIPDEVENENIKTSKTGGIAADYLEGISYTNSFTLPDAAVGNYHYAVCVLDHFGNEYAPRYSNESALPYAPRAVLVYPADGQTIQSNFNLQWEDTNVDSYRLEIATDKAFTEMAFVANGDWTDYNGNIAYSALLEDFTAGTYYWRVITHKEGFEDRSSAIQSFKIDMPVIEEGYHRLKDTVKYESYRNMKIESRWMRSVQDGNIEYNTTGTYNCGFCVVDGIIYVSGRSGNTKTAVCTLEKYDAASGAHIGTLELGSEVQCGTYPCNDVIKDDAGNLLVSNYSLKMSTYPLKLYLINKETGAATLVAECKTTKLSASKMEHCTVKGNVATGNFSVYIPMTSSVSIAQWQFIDGVGTELDPITLTEFTSGVTKTGMAPRYYPLSNGNFVLNSSTTVPTLYNNEGNLLETFSETTDVLPSFTTGITTNGFATFPMKGNQFTIFPISDYNTSYSFRIAKSLQELSFGNMQSIWTIPEKGIGNINSKNYNAQVDYELSSKGDTAKVYIFVPGNGMASYRITMPYMLGDVNDDRTLNVSDITNMVNLIMNNEAVKGNLFYAADMNEDDILNVSDITNLVAAIMASNPEQENQGPRLADNKNALTLKDIKVKKTGSNTNLEIMLNNEQTISAIQFDVELPEGLQLETEDGEAMVSLSRTSKAKHHTSTMMLNKHNTRALIYSLQNAKFSKRKGKICTLPVMVSNDIKEGTYTITLHNIILSTTEGKTILQADTQCNVSVGNTKTVTAINTAVSTSHGETSYYNLQGQQLSQPQSGINIVRKDGKAKKIIL